jgi:hypothetical protein
MANGTWAEASACPKCGLTGEQSKAATQLKPGEGVTRGARLVQFICKNSRCRWYNTPWEVQINPDGTIPDPNARRDRKRFTPLDAAMAAQLKTRFENIQESTLQPGAEIRR